MNSGAAGARHCGQRAQRRVAQELAAGQLGVGHPRRIPQQRGLHHLVVGQPGLDEQPPGPPPTTQETTGQHQQGQRLLGRPVPRRQQLLVEVQERDHVGGIRSVQGRLGAHEHVRRRHRLRSGVVGSVGSVVP